MIANKWYCIAQTNTFDTSCSVNISFDATSVLFTASVKFGKSSINIASCTIKDGYMLSVRLRETESSWAIDLLSNVKIEPNVSIADSNEWTLNNAEAGSGSIIAIISNIDSKFNTNTGTGGGGDSYWQRVNLGSESNPIYAVIPKNFNDLPVHIVSYGEVSSAGYVPGAGGGDDGGGSTVIFTPILTSGKEIAKIQIDGVEQSIYAPESYNVDLTGYATEDWVRSQGYLDNSFATSTTTTLTAHDKRIKSFEDMFEWDGENIKAKANFYSIGEVSSGGLSDTESGVSGDYLPLSGGVITADAYVLGINRTGQYSYQPSIEFYNNWTNIGSIGIDGTKNNPFFYDINTLNSFDILHTGNTDALASSYYHVCPVPSAGTIGESAGYPLSNIQDLSNYKSFIGSAVLNGVFWNVISARHRNGYDDGYKYGLYFRTKLTDNGDLVWDKQMSYKGWQGERVIIDSSNIGNYITGGGKEVVTSNYGNSSYISPNDITRNTFFHEYNWGANIYSKIASVLDISYSPDWRTQLFFIPQPNPQAYIRSRHSGTTWTSWYELIHSGNIGSYISGGGTACLPLTGGTVNGVVTITPGGSYGVQIGAGENTIDAWRSGGETDLWLNWKSKGHVKMVYGGGNVLIGTDADTGKRLRVASKSNQVAEVWSTDTGEASISFVNKHQQQWVAGVGAGGISDGFGIWSTTVSKNILSCFSNGNVLIGTTTDRAVGRLQVAGGVNCNVTNGDSGVGLSLWGDTDATGYGICMAYRDKFGGVHGSATGYYNIYFNNGDVSFGWIWHNNTGCVASISGNGNFVVNGEVTSGSDARYKRIESYTEIDIETIANAPIINFKWIDREDEKVHLGSTAQYWYNTTLSNGVIPTDDEKLWTMGYGQIALASVVSVAKKVVNHEERVKILEKRVNELENELNEYRRA